MMRSTVARAYADVWRRLPVRGGGRVLDRLVLAPPVRDEWEVDWAGGRLLVDPVNPPEVSVWLWKTYEADVTRAFELLVAPGATAVDIGANCGVHSLALHQHVGAAGKVLAIDPSPVACARIRQQCAHNGISAIDVVEAGLGEERGQETFSMAVTGIGALPRSEVGLVTEQSVPTEIYPLDDLLAERGLAPDVIKLDTDGGETSILRGAERLLSDTRPALVFEVGREALERRGTSLDELKAVLDGHGYRYAIPRMRSRRRLARPPRCEGFDVLDDLSDAPEGNVVGVHPTRDAGRQLLATSR